MKHVANLVVGAGTMGSQVAYHLAQRGQPVVVLDAWSPPHDHGAHHGETRLYRQLYAGEGPYVALAVEALAGWGDLERTSGRSLFLSQGVLNLDPEGSDGHRGKVEAARIHGLRAEVFSAAEAARRWPAFAPPAGYAALWEPDAGVLDAPGAVAAALAAARAAGAEVVTGAGVHALEPNPDGTVTVRSSAGEWRANRVVVTAGTSTAGLVPALNLPVVPIRKTVGWFGGDATATVSPGFAGFTFNTPEGQFYGFPSFGGGVKVGRHEGGTAFDPATDPFAFGSDPADGDELSAFVRRYLPGVTGPLVRGAACRYDRTPDEDFRIGQVPGAPIWYATGFSGHGFKFAPAIGKLLAGWVSGAQVHPLLKPFHYS
jgi:N-methyl-L-tryptophan oxidase